MSDAEITELTREGWPAEIIASLRTRGFRPCEADHIAARFDGADPKKTRGFIRQTALPHLHLTLERHGTMREMLERIDTALFEAGLRVGHEGLAGMFMRFFESCKTWRLSPAPAALETRLAKLEAALTAPACDPAEICSAWWMYDNHTFQPVDVTAPNWRGYVMACYDIDGFGSFFVRESPNGKTIFSLHGNGNGSKERDTFAAALAAWTPPHDQSLATAGARLPKP